MADQYRDSCVDRQNKTRKSFKGNPVDPIRVSFYDKDGQRINDVTRSEANCIAKLNPSQKFYYQDGNGYQRELLIEKVNALSILDALPEAPGCPTDPQLCGPPRVQFFGGMGMGAMANAVISPNSRAIIGFDIVNPGFNYLTPPFANLVDECGTGSGGTLLVQMNGKSIRNIVVKSSGDGYLPAPDGSLGGNGRIWKGADECYVKREDGSFYVVPDCKQPENLGPNDRFFPATPPPTPTNNTYPAVTEIEEVFVDDPGFGYEPGDTLEVVPSNGAVLEPVINDRGEIAKVKVINPGIGFVDLPEIIINSPRGYNARLIPVLKVIPIEDIPDPTVIPPGTELVSVVDCVGKITPPQREFDRVPR